MANIFSNLGNLLPRVGNYFFIFILIFYQGRFVIVERLKIILKFMNLTRFKLFNRQSLVCFVMQKIFKTRRRAIVLVLSTLGIAIFLYLLISWLSVSKSEIALAELEKSVTQKTACHEKCFAWRRERENIVLSDLKRGLKKISRRIISDWQNTEKSLEYKMEIIKILALAYGDSNPPNYINDYLNNPGAEQALVFEILREFKIDANASHKLSRLLNDQIIAATSTQEKISILKTMSVVSGPSEIDSYFIILSSGDETALKREVLKNISNIREKSLVFTLEQLKTIENLIQNLETDPRLRQELVLLIGDYHLVFPEQSSALWQSVFANSSLDSLSRAFSADSLNHLAGLNLTLPEISPTEWAEYYKQ